MKILVTGGTGYIGSHTSVELIKAGYSIEILDDLDNSKESVLDDIKKITGVKPAFHKVDLKDYQKTLEVFAENNFDAVIHFAGLKAVGESVEKPLEYYENNIYGTINLLKAMRET
ncbi:SDR family NAD(P)-dependent oxidoreductase, partial [Candidatus Saccharibacteria bacterium]|nr:SDR family NAD(P)-dependent oxidoreductase [Candidatus Saccharibacteria bacterium]